MSTQADLEALLQQGIAAVREGNRAQARELFERVVELDERNEKGWFWLASVVDTDEERRVCLGNVLHINPNNQRAKEALAVLEEKARKAVEAEEVMPGITRRQLTVILGGGIGIIAALILILLVIAVNNDARERAIIGGTETAIAAVAQAATGDALATATQLAIEALTPRATPTRNIPTLPPTWTPPPPPTLPPTRPSLPPPPEDAAGLIAAASGIDLLNNGYLPLVYFDLSQGGSPTAIGGDLGRDPSFSADARRIAYTRYDSLSFDSAIDTLTLDGQERERLSRRWLGNAVILSPQQPRFSPDGRMIAFIGRPENTDQLHVWLLDMTLEPTLQRGAEGAIRRLTDDDATYSYASISPDGRRVLAVRNVRNQEPAGPDVVVIDIETGAKFPITSDYSTFIEGWPRWSADGTQVIYAAAPANEPENYDIVVKAADGTGSPLVIVRDPANDTHPVPSPDGRFIAFSSNRGGAWDIYLLDVTTQALYQLTNTVDQEDYVSDWWQP